MLSERTELFRASLPRLPIFLSIIEAEETVEEMEMLSVELFILLLRIPKRLRACGSVGRDPVPAEALCPWPECRLVAEEAAKREGRTGEAPLGGVRGSLLVEASELELLVRLLLPCLSTLMLEVEAEELSSFRDSALRSLFLKIDLPWLWLLEDEGVCGELPLALDPIADEALDKVDLCPCEGRDGAD